MATLSNTLENAILYILSYKGRIFVFAKKNSFFLLKMFVFSLERSFVFYFSVIKTNVADITKFRKRNHILNRRELEFLCVVVSRSSIVFLKK